MEEKLLPENQPCRGFTLMEILVVMALFSLLLGLSVISVQGTLDNFRLSTTASQIQADFAYASQHASKSNSPVIARFYLFKSKSDRTSSYQFRGYQLLRLDQSDGRVVPLERVRLFDDGVVLFPQKQYTNLFERGIKKSDPSDPMIPIGASPEQPLSQDYRYCSLRFNPDGSTSLETDRVWFLTLVLDRDAEKLAPQADARVLVINSVTSAVRIY